MSLAKLLSQDLRICDANWVDHDTIHLLIDDESDVTIMNILFELKVKLSTITEWNYVDQDTLEITVDS